jgi:hypothetical protein
LEDKKWWRRRRRRENCHDRQAGIVNDLTAAWEICIHDDDDDDDENGWGLEDN